MSRVDWLQLGFLAALFAGVAPPVFVVALRPSRAMQQLGLRGLRRRQALNSYPFWAWSEPSVRWLGTWLSRAMSDERRRALDLRLVRAGDPLGLEPEELVVLSMVCSSLGASVGALYAWHGGSSPLSALFFAVSFAVLPAVRIDSLAQARALRIRRGLPNAVDLLCLGLSAGLDFPSAVRQIVEKSTQADPLVDELSVMLSELQLGKTRREALENFAGRNPFDAVKEFVGFVIQSEEEGNPLAQILSVQADVSRQRRAVLAEELAAKAGLKIILPVGFVMIAVFMLIAAPLMLKVVGEMQNGL
jgi:tight adherence protein C